MMNHVKASEQGSLFDLGCAVSRLCYLEVRLKASWEFSPQFAFVGIFGCPNESPFRFAYLHCSKVQPPVGFWDPLGLSADGDIDVFKRRREVELKHGRSHSCTLCFWGI